MIDQCAVITRTGIVLWSYPPVLPSSTSKPSQPDPIASLLTNVLISSNPGSSSALKSSDGFKAKKTNVDKSQVFQEGASEVKWRVDNELDVIYVAVYPRALNLAYIDDLLDRIQRAFAKSYGSRIKNSETLVSVEEEYDFDERFKKLRIETEDNERKSRPVKGTQNKPSPVERAAPEDEEEDGSEDTGTEDSKPSAVPKDLEEEGVKRGSPRLAALRAGRGRGGKKGGSGKSSATSSPEVDAGKKKKAPRTWDGQAASGEAAKALDYGGDEDDGVVKDSKKLEAQWIDKDSLGQRTNDGLYEAAEMQVATADESSDEDEPKEASNSGIFGFFKSLTGNRTLTESDLQPVMNQMREQLINKNVAANISAQLVETVGEALVGQKIGTFKRVASAVREQTEIALQRILTPRTSTDLLRDILAARKEGRPYSIVFCGVNGVGKSTNLAKVCFWLLQNGLKVLIAGCDTFRSGAVEQLKVHQRNLNALSRDGRVDLFERGYGKDAAGIAKEAIQYAKTSGFDVVLVDTAGRMQDNEPLMRALAKLVTTNNPDKIIFVGEALVGNEAVDQLTKFNRSLRDFSGVQQPREIDGMILTKFDTIDDKVGAAISMTYITGKPIFFVGTGQTYTDLKKLSVQTVVATLLK